MIFQYDKYGAVEPDEGGFRREGAACVPRAAPPAVGVGRAEPAGRPQLDPACHGAFIAYRAAGAVRDHHLRHHRSGVVLGQNAPDLLQQDDQRDDGGATSVRRRRIQLQPDRRRHGLQLFLGGAQLRHHQL